LRRTIIIRNESSTLARAMASVLRVRVPAIWEIGVASANAKITSAIPTSIVVGMLISVSTSQRTSSRLMARCSTKGMTITLSTTVIAADT
jgi:hypothetical protein